MNERCELCGEINCICFDDMTDEEEDALLSLVDLFYTSPDEDEIWEDDEYDENN